MQNGSDQNGATNKGMNPSVRGAAHKAGNETLRASRGIIIV